MISRPAFAVLHTSLVMATETQKGSFLRQASKGCTDCGTPSATPSKVLAWLGKRLRVAQPFCFLEIISSADFMLLVGKYHNTKSEIERPKGSGKCLNCQLKYKSKLQQISCGKFW
jgi:hypothetical protein